MDPWSFSTWNDPCSASQYKKRRSAHVRNCEIGAGTRDRRAPRVVPRAKRPWIRSPRWPGSLSKTHLKRTAPLSHGAPPYAAYVHKGLTAAQRSCCEPRAQPRDKTHTTHVVDHRSFDLSRYPRMHDHMDALDYSHAPSLGADSSQRGRVSRPPASTPNPTRRRLRGPRDTSRTCLLYTSPSPRDNR